MWYRGTRARRRSTGNTRPIATPGEAGIPVSFAKAPAGLSQAGQLHVQAAEVLVGLHVLALSLLPRELFRDLRRNSLQCRAGRGDHGEPIEGADGCRADQKLLFRRGLGQPGDGVSGTRPTELVSGPRPVDGIGILQLG